VVRLLLQQERHLKLETFAILLLSTPKKTLIVLQGTIVDWIQKEKESQLAALQLRQKFQIM
jgi:hypothetical protein